MSRKKKLVNDSPARRAATPDGKFGDLYARPGFLLRRAHQIAVGIFVEECAAVGLTPPQHSVLIMIDRCPTLDQASLARAIGFDRATVGQIVEGLEARRLLRRGILSKDRRRKALALTPLGRNLLKRAAGSIRRTSERLLAPLRPADRILFIQLLQRLTGELNSRSRTPVRPPVGE